MYRGGNWNNGGNAGVFYANGNNPRSNYNTNIGFRPASASTVRDSKPKGESNAEVKGVHLPVHRTKERRRGRRGQKPRNTAAKPRRLYAPHTGQKSGEAAELATGSSSGAEGLSHACHIRKEDEQHG